MISYRVLYVHQKYGLIAFGQTEIIQKPAVDKLALTYEKLK